MPPYTNGIDLSSFVTSEDVDEAIKTAVEAIVIPENTDTKTSIASGDEYIQVNGDLVDNASNTFTITVNVDTLKALIGAETTAAMEFKGATSEIPLLANKGDIYKVTSVFMVPAEQDSENKGFATSIGDSIVCDGDGKWYLIPSGDDVEDTWRPVSGVNNEASLTFIDGNLLEVSVGEDGKITYNHAIIADPVETEDASGNRKYITNIITDGHGHIVSYNVSNETVVDTNDIYNAGNGIDIVDKGNSEHDVSIKIAANEKNLVVNESGLATNFDLENYATKELLEQEKDRAESEELKLLQKIDNKVEKVFYTITDENGDPKKVEGTLLTPE